MRYTAKKIATMLLTMVIVSFLTFVAFSLLSGDAATRLLGTEATPERLEALRIELGLNDPLLVRYGRWLWDALRGDLGTSYRYGQSVSSLIAQRLGPTLTLTALAFALIVAVSIPLGVLSAKYAGGRLDRALTVINQVVMAVPPFFTGILFTYLFGLVLHLFIAGAFPAGSVGHYIGYLFFPALAVALPRIAMTVKLLRTSILDEAQRDYVRTSMSRGRSRSGILYRHVLKNTLVPVLTFLAMTVADLLAGSVVIEQVFAVPGLGRLLLTSIEGATSRSRAPSSCCWPSRSFSATSPPICSRGASTHGSAPEREVRHEKKHLSARGSRAHGAGRRLHCPWPFLDALLPQRHGLFTPAAAVRRAPDGHGQVRPRHFEPRHGRRR